MADTADDDDVADQLLDGLPACMPSPDGVIGLLDGFLGHGQPIRAVAHFCAKALLTLHALRAVVFIGCAVGLLIEEPALEPPEDMKRLTATAGELVGLPAPTAAILLPALAGTGELLAMAGFYSGWPSAEKAATVGLFIMFTCAAYVHWSAGEAVIPPLVFMGIAMLKLCTARFQHSKAD